MSRWGVLSESGTVYGVGRWKNGRERHAGSWWLARLEARRLRRAGEKGARAVRVTPWSGRPWRHVA